MASIVRKAPLEACCLTLDDIRQLYLKLASCVEQAAQYEVNQLRKLQDGELAPDLEKSIADSYRISVVINGSRGQTLIDSTESVFTSINLPDDITNIYFTSTSSYETRFKRNPPQYFILNFDFSKPPLIDFITNSALPTPNNSTLEVYGNSETWVSGIFEIVQIKIRSKSNKRSLIHKRHSYDVFLWLVGFPFSMFALNRVEGLVSTVFLNSYSRIAILVYTFFSFLMCSKALFSYTKWAFPKLELLQEGSKTIVHRRWWFAVITGVVVTFITSIRLW